MSDGAGDDHRREAFQVAYYSDDPDDHSLDVEALAPALLGFGRLVREANASLNGDSAKIKLVVSSDFEHKCFHINFELFQNIFEKAKTLLQDDRVKTAKELLQFIGVIRSAGFATLLDYLKWKKDRPVAKVEKPETPGLLTIQIIGNDNTINISPEVLKLAENRRVLEAIKETLTPVDMNEAKRIEFKDADQPVVSLEKEEIRDIELACDAPDTETVEQQLEHAAPETVVATLYVYSPVYDEKAKRWRFAYGRSKKKQQHIYVDISETSIATDALKRGGAFTNDRYRVRMEVTPPDKPGAEPHHKIVQVIDFTPAPQQGQLALPRPRPKKKTAKKAVKKSARKRPAKKGA
ncbi:hypothetical protein [Bradyrhizobium sp. 1]|uniref:hypothetical protein n=1 Tax=Bradyrhizobium sp. 1 TaxID=241591 RepID=UPI001FF87249|nr:hypothetical protein [Bradyrhizobium sp. 1]MCK1391689.1 hypothetical protein [Bradyrhizobium sp. 1]